MLGYSVPLRASSLRGAFRGIGELTFLGEFLRSPLSCKRLYGGRSRDSQDAMEGFSCFPVSLSLMSDSVQLPRELSILSYDTSNMYKVIPTGWYFDVNIWCYMGSLAVSAHIGHFPNLKIQDSRVDLYGKIAVF